VRIAELAGREADAAMRRCLASLDPEAPSDYRELAAWLACEWRASPPARVGLAGGQGAGKSTLGRLIVAACAGVGLRACVLSIDDFYLPRAERRRLAATVHPLLETRGPPGTHDIALCLDVMDRLAGAEEVEVPIFDKGLDDRDGSRRLVGPFELMVLEGWCVGAAPVDAASLSLACNALEREHDRGGVWRRYVNARLEDEYARLWSTLDALVFLRVPDLEAVRRWRLEQEQARPPSLRLDAAAIDRFVQHYERITLSMQDSLCGQADLTVELGTDHSIAGLRFRVP